MKKLLLILIPCLQLQAQTGPCIFKEPVVQINFGAGDAAELYSYSSYYYRRVEGMCPTDGHYTFTSYTSDCFRGGWITLDQDHTPGDNMGNMLLVNASYRSGKFFSTIVRGLKPETTYEFAAWMLNVCRPSEKCPFPLLPDITIRLETITGKLVSQLNTGDLQRYHQAQWAKYSAMVAVPKGTSTLALVMINHAPGGCGNDFAVDDITFRECVPPPPPVTRKTHLSSPKGAASVKTPVKKDTEKKNVVAAKKPPAKTVNKTVQPVTPEKENITATAKVALPKITASRDSATGPVVKASAPAMRPPPPLLRTRTNTLAKRIETVAGRIRVDLYDNGEIDGDTVSIYHNNILILSHARLSQKAVTIYIDINKSNPHHELVMVANNLGSIPPNTSLMIVNAGAQRHEVFISSNEQKNAKVVFDLKE